MRSFIGNQMRNIAPFLTLIILLVFFSVASRSFASWDNAANILTQISVTGVIAVGLTFVILCAEIDLSVAAIANATGIVVAYFTLQENYVNIPNLPLPGAAAIVLALAACALLGFVNAFGITVIGIPSFIMMPKTLTQPRRSEEHTPELHSHLNTLSPLLLQKKKPT